MNVDVLYFAQLKEAMGTDRETVSVDAGETVADVLAVLKQRSQWTAVSQLPLSYAVNEEIVTLDHVVREGVENAFQVGEGGGLVDHEALDLMKHRKVAQATVRTRRS